MRASGLGANVGLASTLGLGFGPVQGGFGVWGLGSPARLWALSACVFAGFEVVGLGMLHCHLRFSKANLASLSCLASFCKW